MYYCNRWKVYASPDSKNYKVWLHNVHVMSLDRNYNKMWLGNICMTPTTMNIANAHVFIVCLNNAI